METQLLDGAHSADIEKAGEILRQGGVVAIPTETVYGLAANALDPQAVKKIYLAKGRPSDNPLIVHISKKEDLPPLVREVPKAAYQLMEAFWPGPLTIIFKKSELIPRETSGGLDTVAVRLPSAPIARAVIDAAGVPLAAPSANLSGRPSPTRFSHVQADLTGRVEALLDGGDCEVGVESTVLTLAEETPKVLRPGGVTVEQLARVLPEVRVDQAVLQKLEEGKTAASPGMKYKHYAPKAQVILLDASPEEYSSYVNRQPGAFALCFQEDEPLLRCPFVSLGSRYDSETQAHRLFSSLCRLDELGAKKAWAHCPSKRGVGLAVYNRLIRAAAFQVEKPEGPCVVGLTGPTGAGKSTVGKLLREKGFPVIDCDALTRSPAVYDEDCIARLREAFGEEAAPKGVLDRKALAALAFATSQGKKRLEEITFPKILKAVRAALKEASRQGRRAVFLDAPTLFEAGLDSACRRILVVTAGKETRLKRIVERDGITKEQALARMNAQQDASFYLDRADYVIENEEESPLSSLIDPVLREL